MAQLLRECDVLDDDVLDDQQRADLLPGDLEGVSLDLLAVLHDLFGALEGRHFLERLVYARGDEALERLAVILLKELHHGRLRDAEQHAQFDMDLLQVRRVAIRLVLRRLLPDGDGMDERDDRSLHAETLRFEGRRDLAHRHLHAAIAGLHHIRAGRRHDDGAKNQEGDADRPRDVLGCHGCS